MHLKRCAEELNREITKNLIDNVFKELRSAGYVRMIPIPASNGKFKGTEYEIREISDIPYLPTSEDIPTSEDNRQSENMPTIQSTDSKLSTKEEIKVITKIEKDYLFLEWKKLFGALRSRKGVPEKRFNDLSLKQINQLFIKTKEYLAFLDVVKWRRGNHKAHRVRYTFTKYQATHTSIQTNKDG
jgi:hypothetical protein